MSKLMSADMMRLKKDKVFRICAAGIRFGLAFMIPMLAVGVPRLGWFEMSMTSVLMLIGITAVMMPAVCAVCTLVSMLCQSRAYASALSGSLPCFRRARGSNQGFLNRSFTTALPIWIIRA